MALYSCTHNMTGYRQTGLNYSALLSAWSSRLNSPRHALQAFRNFRTKYPVCNPFLVTEKLLCYFAVGFVILVSWAEFRQWRRIWLQLGICRFPWTFQPGRSIFLANVETSAGRNPPNPSHETFQETAIWLPITPHHEKTTPTLNRTSASWRLPPLGSGLTVFLQFFQIRWVSGSIRIRL